MFLTRCGLENYQIITNNNINFKLENFIFKIYAACCRLQDKDTLLHASRTMHPDKNII